MFDWMNDFRFNFYSLGYLIVSSFQFYAFLITLSIKNRSESMRFLGLFLLSITLLGIAFSFGHAYMQALGAYHRWWTVFTSLIVGVFETQIFIHLPGPRKTVFSRLLLYFMLTLTALGLGYFINQTLAANIRFN